MASKADTIIRLLNAQGFRGMHDILFVSAEYPETKTFGNIVVTRKSKQVGNGSCYARMSAVLLAKYEGELGEDAFVTIYTYSD
jgi:hypothetical protein